MSSTTAAIVPSGGSCTIASFRVVFRYAARTSAALPGEEAFPPLLARRRSWDSALRRLAPAGGWRDISAEPGPRVVSAARPPRLIFVGVTGRRVVNVQKAVGRGLLIWRGVDFWASLPSAVRIQRTRLAMDRSCLGLCLLQGCGRSSAHSIGLDPDRITRLREAPSHGCENPLPYPLMGFRRPSRQQCDQRATR
jgi:hypothetical protein